MTATVIYTTRICPYCIMAKRLLDKKGVTYREINVDETPGLRAELTARTQFRTVPQIFIHDQFIGGFDELYQLEKDNKLDALLASDPAD
jgi:glutaredoxin 3